MSDKNKGKDTITFSHNITIEEYNKIVEIKNLAGFDSVGQVYDKALSILYNHLKVHQGLSLSAVKKDNIYDKKN